MTVTNLTVPVITGNPIRGAVLTTSDGTWQADDPPLAYAYQWERCDAFGASCSPIVGATNHQYTLQTADIGSTIRSQVTATETGGGGGGTTYYANPGEMLAKLALAIPGDTVIAQGGTHAKLTLPSDFAAPFVTITCSGSTFQGINTNGKSGYIFDGITSSLPMNPSDYNISSFYVSGASADITLRNSLLTGANVTFKQYCAAPGFARRIVIEDTEITGCGGDLIHIDGVDGLRVEHCFLHDPVETSDHNDAFQIQRGLNWYVLRNTISWDDNGVYGPNQGMMISGGNLVGYGMIANNLIAHWRHGRPIIIINIGGPIDIVNNTIMDNVDTISINLSAQYGPVPGVSIWNNIVESVYMESGASPAYMDTNWIISPRSGQPTGSNLIGTGQPPFVDHVNYELTGGSVARNFGLTRTGTPTVDIDGNTRPTPRVLGCRV